VFICYLLVNEDEYIRHLYFAIKWQQNFLKEMYKHTCTHVSTTSPIIVRVNGMLPSTPKIKRNQGRHFEKGARKF